jgi:hypothetical protein
MQRRAVALLLGLIFCLAVLPAAAYAQSPGSACQREVKYDPAANLTTVECALLDTFTPPIRLMLTANAAYQGKQPNETAKFHFNLSAFRGDSTRRTPPFFKEATTLSLSLETTQLEIAVTGFYTDFFEMNRLFAEKAQASLDRETLRKLLEAKTLAGKWGKTEFKLTDASFQALKRFISDQIFSESER